MRLVVPLFVLAVATAGVLSLSLPGAAADVARSESENVAVSVDDDIAKHMSTINRTMRKLKRGLADAANNAKSLTYVSTLQGEFLAVKVLEPSRLAKLDAAEKKKQLIEAAYRALPEGGALVAIENLIDDERRENAFGLLMSLNMLIEFGDAFDFSGADFRGWCSEAGFQRFETIHLNGPCSAAVAYK